jgi:hypothetical protein
MNRTWKILLSGLIAICLVILPSMTDRALARPPREVDSIRSAPNPAFDRYSLAVPDYIGQKITISMYGPPSTSDSLKSTKPRPKMDILSILTPSCNPNSVMFNSGKLYVACNKDAGGKDYIGVYESITSKLSKLKSPTATIPFDKTISSDEFSSIIAIAFDAENSLWVSSYNNNQIVRIPKASLSSANPTPDKKLVNSPDQPAGITFGQDGSLWVTGQYQGGIVLNFPKTELDKPGNIVAGITTIDATPTYCISNSAPGCQQQAGLFDNPEGIAIFNNDIWVSNNGGDHPASSLVRLRPAQNQSDRFGNGVAAPFSCPGGLKAARGILWVNDQSAPLTNTTCGATDPASGVGKIFTYSPTDLATPAKLNLNPPAISNTTSRPGFGGLDVF